MKLRVKDLMLLEILAFMVGFTFVAAISAIKYLFSDTPNDVSALGAIKATSLLAWIFISMLITCFIIDVAYRKYIKQVLEYEIIKGD